MVVYYISGGTAAVIVNPASLQLGVATTASEAALSAAVAAEAAGATVAAEAAFGTALAAESAATAASAIATTNIWNPVGWAIGAVAIGASQNTPQTVTWGCYKPIIGEIDTGETTVKPLSLADLAAHPKVRQVSVSAIAGSANLPDVQVENKAGEHFVLRGVALPWGSVAYHAERSVE
ncbi:hypothetical protein VI817_007182 [Penicillium citrinum]|nr:hypothetical protein VI817_007182 [Penicillium citrinum]